MELKLKRETRSSVSTIGELFVDDAFQCYTLEDVDRRGAPKVYGQTAIPPGTYTVRVTMSARFKRDLPLLDNVPGFEGVRIHPGNSDKDTDGCILVGKTKDVNFIGQSQAAFGELFPKIQAAADRGETITLEIS